MKRNVQLVEDSDGSLNTSTNKTVGTIGSVSEVGIGATITNMIVLTQAAYDGIVPNATTLYIITG